MTPLLDLPKSRAEIERIQSERKKHALAQARRAPFYKGKLDHVNAERLDDPDEWRKIPLLDKDTLRKLDDRKFYEDFCLPSDDGIAEYWRSGGATGTPLFYPRSYHDIEAAMIGFARIYDCTRCRRGGRAHVSFPLGIHPVGQMLARAAGTRGIAVNWAGSGATTPSVMQLELIERLAEIGPVLIAEAVQHLAANLSVAICAAADGGAGLSLGRGQRLDEVPAADNADELAAAQDRHAFDAMPFQQRRNFSERGIFGRGNNVGRHHFFDTPAVRFGEFSGKA